MKFQTWITTLSLLATLSITPQLFDNSRSARPKSVGTSMSSTTC